MIKDLHKRKSRLLPSLVYYLLSIPDLLSIKNSWRILFPFFKKPIQVKTNNIVLYVNNLMDVLVIKEVVLDKQYELDCQIKPGTTVVDIGAGIGEFSIAAHHKGAAVYSFEANYRRFKIAKKNMKLNKAFSVNLYHHKAVSLDEVFSICDVPYCHFLKIDCEGGEYKLFSECSNIILSRIEYIAMEAHIYNQTARCKFKALLSYLSNNGFMVQQLLHPTNDYLRLVFAGRRKVYPFSKLSD